MNRVKSYIKIAVKNIFRNKAYTMFMLFGISLTFAFIIIVLQVVDAVVSVQSPKTYVERIINVPMQSILDKKSNKPCVPNIQQMELINPNIKEYEFMTRKHNETSELFVGNSVQTVTVAFVDNDYWNIYDYKFVDGVPFKTDYSSPVVVIKHSIAKKYFNKERAIGKDFEFQGNIYKIIGVVEDFSFLIGEDASIWIPYQYNKYIPSNIFDADLIYMFPKSLSVSTMKNNVSKGLLLSFEQAMDRNREFIKNLPAGAYAEPLNLDPDLAPEKLYTENELLIEQYGGKWFAYGAIFIVIILIIVPMISIIMLSRANMANSVSEIALHRAIGASKSEIFGMVITENLILVLISIVIGWFVSYPIIYVIEQLFLNTTFSDGIALLGKMKLSILFTAVIPIATLFCLLSGGIPAWQMSKINIYQSLKGASK